MNVKVEDISSVKKKLFFEVAAEQVDAEIERVYRKLGKTAKIKGFRPGKVPQPVLEQYYAPQMEEQVLTRLINDTYFKALVDHRIAAVADPEILESSPLRRGMPFTYEAQVEVKPAIEARDYTGLSLKKERFASDEKVVEERLEEMRAARSELAISSAEQVGEGDFAVIDFEGFVDGTPFEHGQADDYLLELGSGSFIPGFEEQLRGMRRGEEREVKVTFPENYGNKDLAGKPATFRVRLKEIKEKVLPSLDDEFAKGFGLESLAELREKIAENYRRQETARIEADLRERLVNALIERTPVEVPDTMVANQLDYMLGNVRRRLASQGLSLEMLGLTEESFGQKYRGDAVRQVQGSLILEEIARREEIRADAAEIEERLQEIADMAGAPLEAVKQRYGSAEARQGLLVQIAEEKAVRFLLERAQVEEVERTELVAERQEEKE